MLLAPLVLLMSHCEYDVATPQWENDIEYTAVPIITDIDPSDGAAPGVNTITINGENFIDVPESGVYFDNVPAEILFNSTTSIKVRRPDLVTESCTIKVVPNKSLVLAKRENYRIDSILERYGAFLENMALSVAAVDKDENLYVIAATRSIIKVTSDGEKTTLGQAKRTAYYAVIGPDGKLYLMSNNRAVDAVDLSTGEVNEWVKLPSGKMATCGDFDSNGYFYAGGRRTGLVIVAPNLTITTTDFHKSDEIKGIRVYDRHVYLTLISASPDEQNPALAIWRHSIDETGNLGEKELVFDLTADEEFSARTVNSIYFAADGTLYIGTDAPDPLLIADIDSQSMDYFYMNILPSYCKYFTWGSGNYIYMICGDTELGEEWTVYRVDMGSPVAP